MWCVPGFHRAGQRKMSMVPECEERKLEDYQLELENRIRNLLWTISGDYNQQMKVDTSLFRRSRDIALYDGIKQGALARFFDKDLLGMYLIKKIFMGADENALTFVSQLCIEEAIGDKICQERPGIWEMQKKACEDILEQEYEKLPSARDRLGYLRVNLLRRRIDRGKKPTVLPKTAETLKPTALQEADMSPKPAAAPDAGAPSNLVSSTKSPCGIYYYLDLVSSAASITDTMELIRLIDRLYNELVDPDFSGKASLEQVLAVTMEDLTEFDWKDYLTDEM